MVLKEYFPNNLPAFEIRVFSFVQYTGGKTDFDDFLWNSMSYSTGSFSALLVREVVCKTDNIFNSDVPARIRINIITHTRLLEIPFFLFAMVMSLATTLSTEGNYRRFENQSCAKMKIGWKSYICRILVHMFLSCSNSLSLYFQVIISFQEYPLLRWKLSEANDV